MVRNLNKTNHHPNTKAHNTHKDIVDTHTHANDKVKAITINAKVFDTLIYTHAHAHSEQTPRRQVFPPQTYTNLYAHSHKLRRDMIKIKIKRK